MDAPINPALLFDIPANADAPEHLVSDVIAIPEMRSALRGTSRQRDRRHRNFDVNKRDGAVCPCNMPARLELGTGKPGAIDCRNVAPP